MPEFTPRLNLTKPDAGAKPPGTPWKTDVEAWADQLDKAAAQLLPIHYSGLAVDEDIMFDGLLFDEAVTITKVDLFAREAPLGSALTIDFLKAGLEQTKIATLAAGAKNQSTTITELTYTTAEQFGLKIKSVGSTFEGNDLLAVVHYHVNPLP